MMVGSDVPDIERGQRGGARAGEPMLRIDALDVTPSDIHGVPLRGVSLDVRAGEIVAIAGVAGSGQQELFAALSGEKPEVSAGTIRIGGVEATRTSIQERRGLGAAFVPEDRLGQATLPRASLSDNLALSLPRAESSGALGWLRRGCSASVWRRS